MSVASTEHGNPSQSGFNCFNTNTQQTRFVSGLPAVSANYIYQTDPVRDNYLHSANTRKIAQNVQKIVCGWGCTPDLAWGRGREGITMLPDP